MARPKLSDEERKKRRAAANMRYRIKQGQVPGAIGRPPKNETRKTEVIDGAIVIKKEPRRVNLQAELPDNPTPEDMKRFIVEMAKAAAEVGSAPAMIAAAQTLQKEIDRWERTRPPEIIPPKPRPRIPVEIEIESVKCPHCGKTFEV